MDRCIYYLLLFNYQCADDAINTMLHLLQLKGGANVHQQFKAIGSVLHGVWASLSTIADLWETDFVTIKISARRTGRMTFA